MYYVLLKTTTVHEVSVILSIYFVDSSPSPFFVDPSPCKYRLSSPFRRNRFSVTSTSDFLLPTHHAVPTLNVLLDCRSGQTTPLRPLPTVSGTSRGTLDYPSSWCLRSKSSPTCNRAGDPLFVTFQNSSAHYFTSKSETFLVTPTTLPCPVFLPLVNLSLRPFLKIILSLPLHSSRSYIFTQTLFEKNSFQSFTKYFNSMFVRSIRCLFTGKRWACTLN